MLLLLIATVAIATYSEARYVSNVQSNLDSFDNPDYNVDTAENSQFIDKRDAALSKLEDMAKSFLKSTNKNEFIKRNSMDEFQTLVDDYMYSERDVRDADNENDISEFKKRARNAILQKNVDKRHVRNAEHHLPQLTESLYPSYNNLAQDTESLLSGYDKMQDLQQDVEPMMDDYNNRPEQTEPLDDYASIAHKKTHKN